MNDERYHGPLITNEVSIGYIKLFPWIALFISSLLFWGMTFIDKLGIYKILFIFCISSCGVAILISFFDKLILKFKCLIYLLISLIILVLLIDVDFICLLMLVGNEGIYSEVSIIYNFVMLSIFVLSCSLYSWYYFPKNRGKVWTFNQVGSGDKKKEWRTTAALAFIGAILGPTLLTGYIEKAFGILFGILITVTLPAVIVDAVYAAIYVRKNPDYDELN